MKMLIGGRWTEASDGGKISVLNPATLEKIDEVPAASRADVMTALDCARRGAEEWAACPLHRRIQIIRTFLEAFRRHRAELAELLQRETGKITAAAQGCIDGSLELGEHYAELARTLGGETFPMGNREGTENDLLVTVREPLGVVVCILPYNFPIDAYMHKVIPALLMGNAVLIKPASDTPLTDIRCTQLLLESGVPGNAVQIVTGSGGKIGEWLTSDPRVALVNLTGSTQVGIQIAKNCAGHLHRTHLELGGNDALIILPDADVDEAAEEAFRSRIGNCGQTCCAGKRFLVHQSMRDAFAAKLREKLCQVVVGDPRAPETTCGPLISEKAAGDLEAQLALSVRQGGRILQGGHRLGKTFFEPTLMELTAEADAARDLELFGPVWSMLVYQTVDEAVELANRSMYGLSSGVLGKDMPTMMRVARSLRAGTCVVGGSGAYRTCDQPFGGYKMSGLGREGGRYTLEELSQVKCIVLKS